MILKVVTLNPAWPFIVEEVNATCYKQDTRSFIWTIASWYEESSHFGDIVVVIHPEGCLLSRITIMSTRHCADSLTALSYH